MDGWSEVVAQLEHGMVSVDLPSLPPNADVPLVWLLVRVSWVHVRLPGFRYTLTRMCLPSYSVHRPLS